MTRLPQALRQFLLQSGMWMALCLSAEIVLHLLGWGYPYDYPAVPLQSIFGDFRFYVNKFPFFHTRAFFRGAILTYPAPTAVVLKLFSPFHSIHGRISTGVFLLCLVVAVCVLLRGFVGELIRRGLARRSATAFAGGTLLTSYALFFVIHQGNVEWVVWAIVTAGIWAVWTKRWSLAAVLFGLAAAMKIFPFVFFGLLLARRRFRAVLLGIFVAAVTTVLSVWLVCPDFVYSWQQTAKAIDFIKQTYMLTLPLFFTGFDHSLWTLLKCVAPSIPASAHVAQFLNLYLAAVALAGTALFFFRIRKLPFTNQVLCLSIAAILLPPLSFDYTLIHLYAPFALLTFVALRRRAEDEPALLLAFSLVAFLLSWQAEFILHGIRRGGQFKAMALLALFIVGLVHPFSLEEPAAAPLAEHAAADPI